jgi:hypothetical protein
MSAMWGRITRKLLDVEHHERLEAGDAVRNR